MRSPEQNIISIIEPETINFSFEAPGWTVVGLGLIVLLLLLMIRTYISYRKNKYRRSANHHLDTINTNQEWSLLQKASAANACLKQIALLKYDRNQVAGLDHTEWFDFLNQKTKKESFTKQAFLNVQEGLYNDCVLSKEGINQFINESKNWINTHVV